MSIQKTRDGSPTLFSERYQQTYHSIHGSLTESNHIFLGATMTRDRLKNGQETRVLEIGLGTGLNFLLTAEQSLLTNTMLEYWALEHTIISKTTFDALRLDTVISNKELLDIFATSLHVLHSAPDQQIHSFAISTNIRLHVLKGEATQFPLPNKQYHAVYQDAFSPDVNPELWSPLFFQRIYNTMQAGGRLATFSVRRLVRDNLSEAGFVIKKKPGPPGGKREMLLAIKPNNE